MVKPAFEVPRIVCMKCPAVARVVLAETEAYSDSLFVVVECHGERIIGHLRGARIVQSKERGSDSIPLDDVEPMTPEKIAREIGYCEESIVKTFVRLDLLRRGATSGDVATETPLAAITDAMQRLLSERMHGDGAKRWVAAFDAFELFKATVADAEAV